MQKPFFYITLLLLAWFIYFTEGVAINMFTVWNMLPLFVSLLIYQFGSRHGAYSFLLGSMMLSGYLHLAWFFGWGNINADKSSTIIFVAIPIFSLAAGGIGLRIGKRFARTPAIKKPSRE